MDKFVAAIVQPTSRVAGRSEVCKRRGPQPTTSAETIYACALELLDSEGMPAVTARRVAAELNISTRTLYKCVKNRDDLIRNVVEMHYSAMPLPVLPDVEWEPAVLGWCRALSRQLTEHPRLTELLAHDITPLSNRCFDGLVEVAVREGIPHETADACCRSFLSVTVWDAIRSTRKPSADNTTRTITTNGTHSECDLSLTISWILAGVRAETEPSDEQRESGVELF